jgi:hypothetical protein
VFGALGATTTLVALVGMAAGGLAGDGLGVALPLNVAGAAFVGAGLMAAVLLVRESGFDEPSVHDDLVVEPD